MCRVPQPIIAVAGPSAVSHGMAAHDQFVVRESNRLSGQQHIFQRGVMRHRAEAISYRDGVVIPFHS
jgi:hypothetical protein